MSKRLRSVLLSWMGLVAVGLGLYVAPFSEPAYRGKRLSWWLGELYLGPVESALTESDRAKDARAREAIRAMGTNAIPHLLKLVHRLDPRWKELAVRFLSQFPVSRNWMERAPIEFRFDRIKKAGRALLALRSDGVPALIQLLGDPDAELRRAAAALLVQLGPDAATAVPNLIDALNDRYSQIRALAASALGAIPSASPKTIGALLTALASDPVHHVRRSAADALARHEAWSGAVVPALLSALSDTAIQSTVAVALGRLGPAARDAVPTLVRLADDPREGVRFSARRALRMIDPETAAKAGVQ